MARFILGMVLGAFFAAASPVIAQEAKRSITKIAGDLYRFQNIPGAVAFG